MVQFFIKVAFEIYKDSGKLPRGGNRIATMLIGDTMHPSVANEFNFFAQVLKMRIRGLMATIQCRCGGGLSEVI